MPSKRFHGGEVMEKRVQKKEDGRYIIFYTFPQGEETDTDQKEE